MLQKTKRHYDRKLNSVYQPVKPVPTQVSMFVPGLGQDIANPSTELYNWDVLQDLETVPDQFVSSVSQAAGTGQVSPENTKEKNRLAQKRFRQRKKV